MCVELVGSLQTFYGTRVRSKNVAVHVGWLGTLVGRLVGSLVRLSQECLLFFVFQQLIVGVKMIPSLCGRLTGDKRHGRTI